MHKARENANGSFSIGKTWNLDDLNAIQSFSSALPVTSDDQSRQRAGAVGFIVTITKPYYWQASTSKEKDFFIYSLIKIYKKYTGGRMPELIGFEPQELENFAGSTVPPTTVQRPPRPGSPRQASDNSSRSISTSRPPPSQYSSRQPSEQQQQPPQPHPPFTGQQMETLPRPPPRSEDRPRPSQERLNQGRPSFDHPLQDNPLRTTDSEERIAQIPGSFPTSDFVRNLKPQTSQTQFMRKRAESPATQNDFERREPSLDRPPIGTSDAAQNEAQYRVLHSARTNDDRVRQNGNYMYRPQQATPPRPNQAPMPFRAGPPSSRPSQESLQERGRPSTSEQKAGFSAPRSLRTESSMEDSRPTTSDSRSREPSKEQWHTLPNPSKSSLQPPSVKRAASSEASSYEEAHPPTAVKSSPPDITPPTISAENDELAFNTAPPPPATILPSQSAIPTPPETPTESHRPGLGPMIKSKKSNKDMVTTIRKAATAYNAFKPRVGGAADKLRDQQTSPTGEPDGITGVVPAPSLLKGASQGLTNHSRSQTPDLKPPEQPYQQGPVPMVKVDSPPPKPPSPVSIQSAYQQPPLQGETVNTQSEKPTPPEKPSEEQRRQRRSDHSAQYARTLALDAQILAGRTFDIETSLNDFGWGEEASRRCTYEDLRVNVRKEAARAEAGGWLNAIKQNDDRITALGGMMDRVIGECEELDGLLTLYGVELSAGLRL